MDPQPRPTSRVQLANFSQRHRTSLVTLLFTDIVDSTALKRQLGDRAAATFLQGHRQVVRELLREFPEGEEIETAGDSFLLVFSKPSEAVRFGLRVQTRLRDFGEEQGLGPYNRMGIHLGEVVVEEHGKGIKPKDLYGLQLDTCSRVMSLAQGGQVLLTRGVFDNARQVLKGDELAGFGPLNWASHGPYELKGLEEPVEVCEVAEAARGPLRPPATSEKARRQVGEQAEAELGWRPAVGQAVPNTKWVLEQSLGEGGFGEVWLGRHQTLKELRVFKFCFRADRVRCLKREVTLFRLLKERVGEHPNIVRVLDVYFDSPPYYVEMEHVPGVDLARWCQQLGGAGQIPLELKLEIVAQVAEALQAAHQAGVIHRDVKPANILIRGSSRGNGALTPSTGIAAGKSESPDVGRYGIAVKLTDFGIGQVVSEEYLAGVTRAGFTATMMAEVSSSQTGTQVYMAPELLAGKTASTRSDIYSLGVVLYQLLAGDLQRPVTTDWARQIPDSLLRADLEHCFAGDPDERFAGAAQLARNLRTHPQRQAEEARRERLRQQAAQRHRIAVASAGVSALLLLLAAAMGFGLVNARHERDRARLQAYVSDMKIADSAWRENNWGQAVSVLRHHLPKPGETDLRGFEWRYLWHRCQGDEVARLTHSAAVNCVDISSDGRWVVSLSEGKFRLWDAGARKVARELGSGSASFAQQRLAFSPAGGFLAAATATGVDIWDVSSWEIVRTLPATNAVAAFSGDGSSLATFGDEGLQTWDSATWRARVRAGELKMAADGDRAIALNLDGSLLAASLAKGLVYSRQRADEIALWRLPERERLITETNIFRPTSVALCNDGQWLAAGTWAGQIHLWSVPRRRAVRALAAHQGLVMGLAFSPDSQMLASGGNDQLIHCWEPSAAKQLWTLKGHLSEVWSLRFSADRRWLLSASKDATVRLWQTSRPIPKTSAIAIPPGRLIGGLTPDARRLSSIHRTDWTIEEWDTASGRQVSKVPMQATNLLATLAGPDLEIQRSSFIISWTALGRTDPGKLVHLSATAPDCWAGAAFASSGDGRACTWNRHTGAILHSNKVAERPFVGGPDRAGRGFFGVEFHGNGQTPAFGWHIAEQRRDASFPDFAMGAPVRVPGSADGRWFAYPTTNGTVLVWDCVNHRVRSTLRGRIRDLTAMAFSPDGGLLATASNDGTAQVWDAATAAAVTPPLVGHLSGVVKVSFLPDGKTLVTYSDDRTARLWNIATARETLSGVPLNNLLKDHVRLELVSEDGNVILEPEGENGLRFVRLPTLAEIDAQLRSESKPL